MDFEAWSQTGVIIGAVFWAFIWLRSNQRELREDLREGQRELREDLRELAKDHQGIDRRLARIEGALIAQGLNLPEMEPAA